MVNYQNGKIYKVEDAGGNMCYIGSTTKDFLSKRMVEHRSKYKLFKNGVGNNISVFEVFDKYGLDNCRIVLIELCPCNSRYELHAREAHYIKVSECVNKVIPNRTKKEYYFENKDNILINRKAYHIEHRESILLKQKAYHTENKEDLNNKCKQYHIDNREKILAQRAESVNCICGVSYTQGHKTRHFQSKFHLKNTNEKPINEPLDV